VKLKVFIVIKRLNLVKQFISDEDNCLDESKLRLMPWWKKVRKYDILADHARYSPQTLEKVMQKPFKLITVLRDPVERFKSRWAFTKLSKLTGFTLEEAVTHRSW